MAEVLGLMQVLLLGVEWRTCSSLLAFAEPSLVDLL